VGKIAKYINIKLLVLLILLSGAMGNTAFAMFQFNSSTTDLGTVRYDPGQTFTVSLEGKNSVNNGYDNLYIAIIRPKLILYAGGSYLKYTKLIKNPMVPVSTITWLTTPLEIATNLSEAAASSLFKIDPKPGNNQKAYDAMHNYDEYENVAYKSAAGFYAHPAQQLRPNLKFVANSLVPDLPIYIINNYGELVSTLYVKICYTPVSNIAGITGQYYGPNNWPDTIWGTFNGRGVGVYSVDLTICDETKSKFYDATGTWQSQASSINLHGSRYLDQSKKYWHYDLPDAAFSERSGHSFVLLSRALNDPPYSVYEEGKELSNGKKFIWDADYPIGESTLMIYSGKGSVFVNGEGLATNMSFIKILSNITDEVSPGSMQMKISGPLADLKANKWISYTNEAFVNLAAGEGRKTIIVDYKDGAQNITTTTHQFVYDKTAPTGEVYINDNLQYTNSGKVTLTLHARDPGGIAASGLSSEVLVGKAGAFTSEAVTWTYTGALDVYEAKITNWSLPFPTQNGTQPVYIKFKDKAGNLSATATDSIILDLNPVGVPTITNPSRTGSVQNITAIEGTTPQDASSRIAYVEVKIMRKNNDVWESWSEYTGWTASEMWKTTASTDNYRHWNLPPTYYNGNLGKYMNNFPAWEEGQTYTITARSVAKTGSVSAPSPESDTRKMTIDRSGAVISSNNITASPDPAKSGTTLTITITDTRDALSMIPYPPDVTVGGWNAAYNYDYNPLHHTLTYRYDVSQYTWNEGGGGHWAEKDREGVNKISVVGQDAAGNTVTGEGTVTFDFTSPTGAITIEGGVANVPSGTGTLNLNLSVSDNLSPANEIHMIIWGNVTSDTSWNQVFEQPYSRSLIGTHDGLKVVYVQYKDKAGNTSEVYSDTIYVGAITGSRVDPFDPLYTSIESFTVTWGTGADKYTIRYKYNNGSWMPWLTDVPAPQTSAVFTATQGEGTYYFQSTSETSGMVESKDPATFDAYMILDRTPPTGTVTIGGDNVRVVGGAKYAKDNSIDLVLSGSDGASGSGLFNKVFITNDNSSWPGAPNKDVTWESGAATVERWLLPSEDGTKTVYVKFLDNAGNITTTATWDSAYYDHSDPQVLSIDTPSSTVDIPTISPISGTARDVIYDPYIGANIKGGSGVNTVEVRIRIDNTEADSGSLPYKWWNGTSWIKGGSTPTGFWLPIIPTPVSGSFPDTWSISSNLPTAWPSGDTKVKIYARAIDKSGRISAVFGPKTVNVNPTAQPSYTINLISGKNWVSVPYHNNYTDAKSLLLDVNGKDGSGNPKSGPITSIVRLNPATQQYESATNVDPIGWIYDPGPNSFPMVEGDGYEITVNQNTSITLHGSHDPNFTFSMTYHSSIGNKHWISVPQESNYANGQLLINSLNGENLVPGTATSITRLNPNNKQFESVTYNDFLGWIYDPGPNPFPVVKGEAFEVTIKANTTWKPTVQ